MLFSTLVVETGLYLCYCFLENDIERLLLLISDGEPNDAPETILNTVKRKLNEHKHRVRIITFGLGDKGILSQLQIFRLFCLQLNQNIS